MAVKFLDGITINSGSGSAATIIAEGTRPVTITGGAVGSVAIKGSAGGWATGYFFTGSSGTFRGGIGALGNGNNISYYFIGDAYNDTTMVVQPNAGNVGIGTTAPTKKLDVNGDVTFGTGNKFQTTTNAFEGVGANGVYLRSAISSAGNPSFSNSDDTNTGMFLPGSDVLGLSTAGSERLRITSAGNVGIGTTVPAEKLQVNGAVRATSYKSSDGSAGITSTFTVRNGNNSASLTFVIKNGIVTSVTSDRRLKENITLVGTSDSGINIYTYEYKYKFSLAGVGLFQGVMSDEVPAEAVSVDEHGYDMVDYSLIDVEFKRLSN
jgi:hypothetical protein